MKANISISGLREVAAGLEQFKKSTQTGVLNRVLKKAAKPVEQAAKRNAPVDSGELRDSIKTEVVRGNPGKAAYGKAMRGGASAEDASAAARAANAAARGRGASALVRVRASAPHAIFSEAGTIHQEAHPFMGPALRAEQGDVVNSIRADLATEIEKTARRVAARAAKKAST
jgi:HK97 gp10 family phage protein